MHGGINPNAPILDQLPPFVLHERSAAEEAINRKWDTLGGSPGEPLFPGPEGLIAVQGGFFRQYARGRICRNRAVGDEAFYVHRAEHRYDQLGGPNSFLGWPTSDDLPDPVEPDSGVTKFQNGAIYWWPDMGAIEMQHISLRYVGLHCFGESDEPSASDEPYVTFGVVSMITDLQNTVQTRIYEGVDAGESRGDDLELYRGLPFGITLSITLAEHDHGDPNKYKEEVKVVVKKVSDKVEKAAEALGGLVPVIGTALGAVAGLALALAGPTISSAVNELLGTDDDHLSTVELTITPKDMMRLARFTERQNFFGMMARLESPLLSGDGASYKVYFDIEAVQ